MRCVYPLLFERSMPGRRGADLPALDVPALECILPESLVASEPLPLPELAEVDEFAEIASVDSNAIRTFPAAISVWTTGSIRSAPAR